ncbi:MAG: FlgD immunoglobulin-like domain containing protein, partial [Candidatus Latescibacterota bacterium]
QPYIGSNAYIELADLATGAFGHINVDDITESLDIVGPADPGDDSGSGKSRSKVGDTAQGNPGAQKIRLYQNSPNPFNPATAISYYLPVDGQVSLDVYNVSGARIRRLVNTAQAQGMRQVVWNGRNDSGIAVSAGIYFYRLMVDGIIVDTKKMALLK